MGSKRHSIVIYKFDPVSRLTTDLQTLTKKRFQNPEDFWYDAVKRALRLAARDRIKAESAASNPPTGSQTKTAS